MERQRGNLEEMRLKYPNEGALDIQIQMQKEERQNVHLVI